MSQILFSSARRSIIPKLPVSLAGYFNLRMWDKVLDEIEVRVLALRQNRKEFLLVQFDLITVPESLYLRVMKGIASLKNWSEENVLITATHTHTAPTPREKGAGTSVKYCEYAAKQAIAAIKEATQGSFRKGDVSATLTADERFEFNRRYWMADGTVKTNPGRFNPDIVKPEGAVDYEIPILAITCEGRLEVVLANIVNHTDTTDGCGVSADWAGWTHREVEKKMDGASPIMFPLIGAAGNINHFDVASDFNQSCPAEAKRIGTGYAATVWNALQDLQALQDFELKTVFAEVCCGPAEISKEELAEAKKTLKKYAKIPDVLNSSVSLTSEDLAKNAPVALKYFAASLVQFAEENMQFRFRLTGFSMGPVVIASLPSEPFCEIGLDIRKRYFSDKLCFVVSHGNGTGNPENGGGYIPNYWNYGRGGYETTVRSNPFEKHLSEKLREAWADLARSGEL